MCELIFSAFPCRLISRIEFCNDTAQLELVSSQRGAVVQQIQLQQIMSLQLKPKSGMQVDIKPYKAI